MEISGIKQQSFCKTSSWQLSRLDSMPWQKLNGIRTMLWHLFNFSLKQEETLNFNSWHLAQPETHPPSRIERKLHRMLMCSDCWYRYCHLRFSCWFSILYISLFNWMHHWSSILSQHWVVFQHYKHSKLTKFSPCSKYWNSIQLDNWGMDRKIT